MTDKTNPWTKESVHGEAPKPEPKQAAEKAPKVSPTMQPPQPFPAPPSIVSLKQTVHELRQELKHAEDRIEHSETRHLVVAIEVSDRTYKIAVCCIAIVGIAVLVLVGASL